MDGDAIGVDEEGVEDGAQDGDVVEAWMELKAFDASMRRAASVSSFSNVSLIA